MRSTILTGPIGLIHILEASAPVTAGESEAVPVVFVHGMVLSASIWDTQLARLAGTRRAIALDVRGHGDSAPPEDGNYAPVSCAADVLAVLDGLGLDRVAIVGNSFGACIALAGGAIAFWLIWRRRRAIGCLECIVGCLPLKQSMRSIAT